VNVNDFLKTSNMYLTLMNDEGESYTTGAADFVKPLSSKTTFRWITDGKYGNVSPFTYAILHGSKKVFDALYIKPILPERQTVIEIVY